MTETNKRSRDSKPSGATADNNSFDKAPLPDKIGSSLRNLYDSVLTEDVPDDFMNLLRQADKKSPSKTGGASEGTSK